jgi:hypothetical protein
MVMAMERGKRVRLNTGMGIEMKMEMGMESVMGMVKEERVLGAMATAMAMVVEMGRTCSERTFLERTADTITPRTLGIGIGTATGIVG